MAENDVAGRRLVSPAQVGRGEELTRLVSAVLAPPAVVVVDGEAGIGKTRLVTELAARPEVRARRLLVGRCHRIRESFPLGPVVEAVRGLGAGLGEVRLSAVAGALRPLLPEVADLLPGMPEPLPDRGAERHRVFRGLVEVLEALGPVALVLEDMHWADEQTADFVGYVLSEAHPQLCVVLTFRGEQVDPSVRALTAKLPGSTSRTELTLTPLDERDTGALAASIMGVDRVSDEFAAYLRERTSGLPFAIEELLALLRTRGTLVRRGGEWARRALDELDVPSSIRDSVLERVSRLSGDARSVVEAAAVLQVPISPAVLDATGRTPPPQALAATEEALESGLLAEDGDSVGFRHLLAAQAVYEDVPGPRRRDLHGRAAAALASARPVPLGQVAHHLRHAGRLEEWVGAAQRAADQALALGHDAEAVRLLEDVLRYGPIDADAAGRLAVKLGQAAIEALRSRDVIDLMAEILERDLSASVRGELRFRMALLVHEAGDDPVRERRLFADAVEELDDRPDLKAWAMVVLGIPIAEGVEPSEHRRWLQQALEILPAVGDPDFEAFLLGKVAMVLASIGDPLWRDLTARIEQRAGGRPRRRPEVNAYWSVGAQACYAGDHETADRLLTAALEGAVAGESTRLELSIRSGLVLLDYCRGSWDGLGDNVDVLVDELAEHPRSRIDVECVAGCLAMARGNLDEANDRLARNVDLVEALGGFDLLPLPMAALVRLTVSRGDVDAALTHADRMLRAVERKGVWATAVRALPVIIEAYVAAGRVDAARSLVTRYTDVLSHLDVPLGAAALGHARGFLATGAPHQAAGHFVAAAQRYESLQCPYEAAQARERAALSLLCAGDPAAHPPLLAALDAYRRLGATWDGARATKTARRHGVPVPARHRGGRRGYGTELSPREREVAQLAATGRSNKEIAADLYLSVNTVARHITAAMRKLDVRSRAAITHRLAELADAGGTRGGDQN